MKYYISMSIFAVMLLVVGCNIVNPIIDDDLLLSTKKIKFDEEGGYQKVVVTTSASDFTFITYEESQWLEIKKEKDGLIVRASANTGDERSGRIIVHAGNINNSIDITQKAADSKIMLGDDALIMPVNGGREIIKLSGAIKSLDIKAIPKDVDWLEYRLDKERSEIEINIDEINKGYQRDVTLLIEGSGFAQEFKVIQKGVQYYFFPIELQTGTMNSVFDVVSGEKERNNSLVGKQVKGNYLYVNFEGESQTYTNIVYQFSQKTTNISGNWVNVSFTYHFEDISELNAYLEQFILYGYKVIDEKTKINHKEYASLNGEETVQIDIVDKSASIVFTREEEQYQEFPTFSKFPFVEDAIGMWDQQSVAEYERKQGNNEPVFNDRNIVYYRRQLIESFYYELDSSGIVTEIGIAAGTPKEYNLFLWLTGGQFKLTKEFKELITNAGYLLQLTSDKAIVYHNPEKHTLLTISFSKQTWGDFASLSIKKEKQ